MDNRTEKFVRDTSEGLVSGLNELPYEFRVEALRRLRSVVVGLLAERDFAGPEESTIGRVFIVHLTPDCGNMVGPGQMPNWTYRATFVGGGEFGFKLSPSRLIAGPCQPATMGVGYVNGYGSPSLHSANETYGAASYPANSV